MENELLSFGSPHPLGGPEKIVFITVLVVKANRKSMKIIGLDLLAIFTHFARFSARYVGLLR